MEVVHLRVPVEELTRLSSSSNVLLEAISKVLGVSLSEVREQYFRPSDDSDIERMMAEERFSLHEDLQEQEWFIENARREREMELKSYQEDADF
jgi:hypothetical protein